MLRITGFFLLALLILLGPSVAALAPADSASAAGMAMDMTASMSEGSATSSTSTAAPGAPGAPYPGVIGDMMDCFLPSPAFCDNFSEGPYRGGLANRGGDLDPTKWSFSRLTEGENAGQGAYFAYPPAVAQFCQTKLPGVLPDRDSFMCNGTNGTDTTFRGTEPMHWMSTINDGGNYVENSARALQPFDFAGRTGTVAFAVDAVTRGPHSFWPDVVLTDQPAPGVHENKPGVDSRPRNGVEIDFNAGCGGLSGTAGSGGSALSDFNGSTIGQVAMFSNYVERDLSPPWPWAGTCATTGRDDPNLILLRVSQTSLDVYMADKAVQMMGADGKMMMSFPTPRLMLHLDQSSGFSLPFTRGYVSFQQAHYNGAKFNGESTMTYHWHDLGFDGPVLPPQRAYEVPDANTPVTMNSGEEGTVVGENIGYAVDGARVSTCCISGRESKAAPFTLAGVDLTGALSADVTFDFRIDNGTNGGVQVRVNNGAWHAATFPPGSGRFAATQASAAIPLSEIQAGTNTLTFNIPSGAVIANIDLVIDANTPSVVTTTTSTTSTMTADTTAATTTVSATTTTTSTPPSTVVGPHRHWPPASRE